MFQLRHLKTFLAAAETLSFTRAAQQVHLSQPSVTEQIQALEHSVGRPLFLRQNNSLSLTEAGESLRGHAQALLRMADDTLRLMREGEIEGDNGLQGTLTLAAPQTLCTSLLGPQLAMLGEAHPRLQLALRERNSAETARAVSEGAVDLGLVHGRPREARGLKVETIARDRPVLLMPEAHPLACEASVAPAAIAGFALVQTAEGCRYREYLDALLLGATVRPRARAEAESVAGLAGMVAAGLGLAVLPRLAALAACRHAPLQMRPLIGADDGLPICLLSAEGIPARAAALALAERLRAACADSDEPMPALDM